MLGEQTISGAVPALGSPPDAGGSSSGWVGDLVQLLGTRRVSLRAEDRAVYARDLWPRLTIGVADGVMPTQLPGVIVWPENATEVAELVGICRRHRLALVPYGAGSGVGGAAVGPPGSLVLDTKRMRSLRIDAESRVVECGPGWLGWHLEQRLNRQGLSLGHFPSSIMCSTVGGWVATRSAGQMSTKYGKIEDLVRGVSVVTGTGQLVHATRGTGPDLTMLLTGSEGTLGVLTDLTLSARPLPKGRALRGYAFPSIEASLRAIHSLMASGLRPAVLRVYDEIDTLIAGMGRAFSSSDVSAGGKAGGLLAGLAAGRGLDLDEILRLLRPDTNRMRGTVERWFLKNVLGDTASIARTLDGLLQRLGAECRLIVGFEGEVRVAECEDEVARQHIARCGGRDLGPQPGLHWLKHRYDVSFKLPRVFQAGAFGDTIEVATTWDRLLPLYHEVRAAISQHALCMAHFSHAYSDGCSIYFTVLARREGSLALPEEQRSAAHAADLRRYDAIWQAALEATLHIGGTISHHHGIGRLKTPFLPAEQGAGLVVMEVLKAVCDPENVHNPGNLLPVQPAQRSALRRPAPEHPALLLDQADRTGLVTLEGSKTLFEIEQALRTKRLSLGGVPPQSWTRTLAEALGTPHLSEAGLSHGRLRDRVAQIHVRTAQGRYLTIPPQPVPRRATGPDTMQLFVGSEQALGSIERATLRVVPMAPPDAWLGRSFSTLDAALHALGIARGLHATMGLQEVLLCNAPLVEKLLGHPDAAVGPFVLMARGTAPKPVADRLLAELASQLSGTPLDGALCRACFEPNELWEGTLALGTWASRWPAYERPVLDTHESLRQQLQDQAQGWAVQGVYLHGLVVRTESPIDAPVVTVGTSVAQDALCWALLDKLRSRLAEEAAPPLPSPRSPR